MNNNHPFAAASRPTTKAERIIHGSTKSIGTLPLLRRVSLFRFVPRRAIGPELGWREESQAIRLTAMALKSQTRRAWLSKSAHVAPRACRGCIGQPLRNCSIRGYLVARPASSASQCRTRGGSWTPRGLRIERLPCDRSCSRLAATPFMEPARRVNEWRGCVDTLRADIVTGLRGLRRASRRWLRCGRG